MRVPGNDRFLKPSKDRVESHCKQEAARWSSLSYSLGHEKLSPSRSCEFHMSGTVIAYSSQLARSDCQWAYAAAKSVKRIPDSCGAHTTWARAVVSSSKMLSVDLSGRDASLRRVYASHGVPVEPSTNCCGEKLSIAINASMGVGLPVI